MEEKILFSPVAKSCFQAWELELFQGRSRKLWVWDSTVML